MFDERVGSEGKEGKGGERRKTRERERGISFLFPRAVANEVVSLVEYADAFWLYLEAVAS